MRLVDTVAARSFSPERFQPKILAVTPDLKIPLICMEGGQKIPSHPGGTGFFHVIEGRALFTVNGKTETVEAGSVAVVPKGAERGLEAEGRLVVIAFHME